MARNFSRNSNRVTAFLAVGILAVVSVGGGAIAYSTKDSVTFTVKNKESIVENNSSKYLIYTNKGVFENEDSLWYLKFDSSDLYNELEKGKTYEADVYGFRVPILSLYKNIVDVREYVSPVKAEIEPAFKSDAYNQNVTFDDLGKAPR